MVPEIQGRQDMAETKLMGAPSVIACQLVKPLHAEFQTEIRQGLQNYKCDQKGIGEFHAKEGY